MKPYQMFIDSTKEERAESLKSSVENGAASKDAIGVEKKTSAKVLAAMIDSGDCEAGDINKTAEKVCGREIRKVFQGVYELRVVFSSIVAGDIDLTEEDFDKLDASKLALISPFILKDELKPKLGEAVAKLKDGGTAKDIREIKGGEKKEPKAVKEMREKAEAAEKRAVEAEAKAKEIESRYTVDVAFACTDIQPGDAVLKSDQLRARLMRDLTGALERGDEETLTLIHAKAGRLFMAACRALQVDPRELIDSLASETAKSAAAATQTIEVAAA